MKTIKTRLMIITLILVILPFILSNLMSIVFVSDALEKYIKSNNQFFGNYIAQDVQKFMEKAYSVTEELAYSSDAKSMIGERQAKILVGTSERNKYFDLLYIQGTDGMQTAKSSGKLGDRSSRWWFKQIMGDQKPFVSKSYYSLTGNVPVTSVFLPIYDDNSSMIGIMGADIKLDALQKLVEKTNLGKGSYAYIIDGEGVVIAHPEKQQVSELYNYKTLEKEVLVKDSAGNIVKDEAGNQKTEKQKITVPEKLKQIVKSALAGENGIEEYTDNNGNAVISAYTSIQLPGNSAKWAVITVQNKAEAMGVVSDISNRIAALAILLIVVVAVIIYLVSGSISKPLTEVREALSEASSGNLTTRAKATSKDEVGTVSSSFNAMMDNIGGLIKEVKGSSNTVLESSKYLDSMMHQTSVAVNEVAVCISEIARSTNDQAANTKKGNDKVHELADGITKVLDLTTHIDGISVETSELVDKGLKVVEKLTVKSDESSEASKEVSEILQTVDNNSKEVGVIVETIGQIAGQTNLLALNAAIEAARAGENGSGFAVVADEIRKLAERSGEAVKMIQKLVTGVQNKSKVAVQAMNNANTIIEEQNTAVDETRDIFSEISQSVNSLTKQVEEIKIYNKNMTEMKDGITSVIGEIAKAAEGMSAITEQVSASIEQQSASFESITAYVKDLSGLAGKLEKSVEKFKVEV